MILPEILADAERTAICEALREKNGNRTEAAKRLGIPRRQLYRRMAALFTPEQLAAMAIDPPKEKSK